MLITNDKLLALGAELQAATKDIKYLNKLKRAATFDGLNQLSKNLHMEKEEAAVSKQGDIVDKLTAMVGNNEATLEEVTAIVKRYTR